METSNSTNVLVPEGQQQEAASSNQLWTFFQSLQMVQPDSTAGDGSGQIYLINSQPEQPAVRVAEAPAETIQSTQPEASPRHKGKKKRRRVVCKKRRFSSSSSSFNSSLSSGHSSSPKSAEKSSRFVQPAQFDESAEGNVCRFHCKKCGQLRFLLVRGGLPVRECDCGSTCVSVPAWVKAGHGLTGGGLGRESFACPRCLRIYSSDAQLRRHTCSKKTTNTQENAVMALGVKETPTCPVCSESFIFDKLLSKHIKRNHPSAKV